MPVMDGFEATTKILQTLADANDSDYCHVVALTSYTSDETKDRIRKIGAKDVIHKPINSKDLQKMVYLHFFRKTEEDLKDDFPHLY